MAFLEQQLKDEGPNELDFPGAHKGGSSDESTNIEFHDGPVSYANSKGLPSYDGFLAEDDRQAAEKF